MKQENQFDSFIKEKIGEWETTVPDRIWNAIEEDQEKKRRAAFWWRFRTSMLVIVGIAISLISYRLFFAQPESQSINFHNEKSIYKDAKNVLKSSDSKSKEMKGNGNADVLQLTDSKTTISPIIKSENKDVKNKEAESSLEKNKSDNEYSNAYEEIKSKERKAKLMFSSSHKSKQKKGSIEEMIDDNKEKNNQVVSGLDITNIEEGGKYDEEIMLKYDADEVHGLQRHTRHDFSKLVLSKNNFQLQKDPIPCPNTDIRSKKVHFEIYTGTDFVLRKFSDTPNSLYLLKRKETQTVKSAFQFGIRFNKPIGSGFSLSGGFQYNQINEQFRHTQGNIINYTYVIDAIGDTIQTIQTISTRYKQISNRYQMIELPLMLGYEFSLSRISVRMNAGVQFNLISRYRGEVLDDQLVPVSISREQSTNPFQLNRSLGMSYVGSVGFYYGITANKKIFIEPHFQYRTKTITSEQLSLKQKDNLWGIRAGLRIPLSF